MMDMKINVGKHSVEIKEVWKLDEMSSTDQVVACEKVSRRCFVISKWRADYYRIFNSFAIKDGELDPSKFWMMLLKWDNGYQEYFMVYDQPETTIKTVFDNIVRIMRETPTYLL